MIHTVTLDAYSKRSGPYCGPYAVAAVTGITYAEACRRIKQSRRDCGQRVGRTVKGSWTNEIGRALGPGWIFNHLPGKPAPTFGRFLSLISDRETYVVWITGHYVAVSDGYFIDNRTRRRRLIKNAPYKRSTVLGYWKLIGGNA